MIQCEVFITVSIAKKYLTYKNLACRNNWPPCIPQTIVLDWLCSDNCHTFVFASSCWNWSRYISWILILCFRSRYTKQTYWRHWVPSQSWSVAHRRELKMAEAVHVESVLPWQRNACALSLSLSLTNKPLLRNIKSAKIALTCC